MDLFANNTCGCEYGKYAALTATANTLSSTWYSNDAQWIAGNQPNGTLASCMSCRANCTTCSDNTGICLTCIPGYTIQRHPTTG